jgi:hypothetical protein
MRCTSLAGKAWPVYKGDGDVNKPWAASIVLAEGDLSQAHRPVPVVKVRFYVEGS